MNVIHYRKYEDDAPRLGRPRLYDDEQRKQRHREAEIVRNMLIEKFHGLDMATSSLVEHFRSTVRTGTEKAGEA